MQHCESDVERQLTIQGIHLSAFCNYVWKREESFKVVNSNTSQNTEIVNNDLTDLNKMRS